jgi:hypothetical protein
MRDWREYQASIRRLYRMEYEAKRSAAERQGRPAEVVPHYTYLAPALEWWNDNFTLLRDALIRRYPLHMVSYGAVLREPAGVVRETLGWLGRGDQARALAVVRESLRTQSAEALQEAEPSGLTPAQEELFDELYRHVDQRLPLSGALIDRLNDTHDQLEPRIAEAVRAAGEQRRQAAQAAARHVVEARPEPSDVDET